MMMLSVDTGVILEIGDVKVEDTAWMRQKIDACNHINAAEVEGHQFDFKVGGLYDIKI